MTTFVRSDSLDLGQTAIPTNPSAGRNKLYLANDGNIYRLNSAGVSQKVAIGAGATGDALLATATQDAARGVLGLAAIFEPPHVKDHHVLTWVGADIAGSASVTNYQNTYFFFQSGATANSTYRYRIGNNENRLTRRTIGFANWTRYIQFIAGIQRSVANAQGVFRVFYGKDTTSAFGKVASGHYVGYTVNDGTVTELFVCKANVITSVPCSVVLATTGSTVCVTSNNGAVTLHVNNVLAAQTAEGPILSNGFGSINLEINNGATAAAYSVIYAQSSSIGY